MTLRGYLSYNSDPMAVALSGMMRNMKLVNVATDNLAYADIPGYQKKVAVTTSFAEYLGDKGVNIVTDTSVGRLLNTNRPLDTALSTKGYYQKRLSDGRIELTRDGRLRINAQGVLESVDGNPILSNTGAPIQFNPIPERLDRVRIQTDGRVMTLNNQTGELELVGKIGIVASEGKAASEVDLRQGYVEHANVMLHEEYMSLVGQGISANRQIFLTQSTVLSRLVQEMGRTQ